jgi:hypothetical protein
MGNSEGCTPYLVDPTATKTVQLISIVIKNTTIQQQHMTAIYLQLSGNLKMNRNASTYRATSLQPALVLSPLSQT